MAYELRGVDVPVLSIAVWFLGTWLAQKIWLLKKYSHSKSIKREPNLVISI